MYNVINLQLELKKTVLDRMVHLLSRGCVIPVVTYIKSCWERRDTDISLIRHFVTEVSQRIDYSVENEDVLAVSTSLSTIRFLCQLFQVLDVIAPPYTVEFVQLFLPLIDNEDITGSLRSEDQNDPVSEFIGR